MYTRPCDYIQLTQFFAQQIKSLSRWAASPLPFTALGDTSQNWREASAWDAGAHRITRHLQGHLFSPLYLIDEETEYQRGQETCLRSQSLLMAKKKKKKGNQNQEWAGTHWKRPWGLPTPGSDPDKPTAAGRRPLFPTGRTCSPIPSGLPNLRGAMGCPMLLHPNPKQHCPSQGTDHVTSHAGLPEITETSMKPPQSLQTSDY